MTFIAIENSSDLKEEKLAATDCYQKELLNQLIKKNPKTDTINPKERTSINTIASFDFQFLHNKEGKDNCHSFATEPKVNTQNEENKDNNLPSIDTYHIVGNQSIDL